MLIDNIGTLVTNDPELGTIKDAALVFDDGLVAWAGPRAQAPEAAGTTRLDAEGRAVIPGFVDSHGHLVFAGDRAEEFAARMEGRPYTAGGIRTTVAATRAATDEQLGANLDRLIHEALRSGTTTVETKSGYGLTVPDERRSLGVACEIRDLRQAKIRRFEIVLGRLASHAIKQLREGATMVGQSPFQCLDAHGQRLGGGLYVGRAFGQAVDDELANAVHEILFRGPWTNDDQPSRQLAGEVAGSAGTVCHNRSASRTHRKWRRLWSASQWCSSTTRASCEYRRNDESAYPANTARQSGGAVGSV